MDKTDIKSFMDSSGGANVHVFTDEDIMYNTKGENSIMVFDYDKEVVHVIRTNIDVYTQSEKRPFEVIDFEFSRIVYMKVVTTQEDAITRLESIKTLMSDTEYDRAINILRNTSIMAVTSSYGSPAGGNYKKPGDYPIINGNTGKTIYDPNKSQNK